MNKKDRSETTIRYLVQGFFLVFVTYLLIMHGKKGVAGGYSSVDTLCPFGGLGTIYHFLSDGSFLKRVGIPAVILLIGTVLSALIVGRAFCGTICPLGTIQEWLYNFWGKIIPSSFRKIVAVPSRIDGVLRYVKYILLVIIIAFTWIKKDLVFRPFDPWAAYSHTFGDWAELAEEFLWGSIILALIIVSTIFISRAWCKYLCPFGGFLGMLAKISWLKINRNSKTCINCKACNKSCPMNIDVVGGPSRVTSAECIECGSCVAACPVPDTLIRKAAGPSLTFTPYFIPLLAVLFFGGTYGIAKVSGYWKTANDIRTYTDIKGSNSIQQIANAAGVSVKKLLEAAGLPTEIESEAALTIKALGTTEYKEKYSITGDFGTDVIKEAFAKLIGESYVPESVTSHAKKEEAAPELVKHDTPLDSDGKSGKKLVWGTDVKASTSLNDVLQLSGISKTEFLVKFDLPADLSDAVTLKDMRDLHGKDMETIKAYFGVE